MYFRSMNRNIIYVLILILLIIIGLNIYIENKKVVVAHNTLFFKSLPSSFDEYKILLIADLHGEQKGDKQSTIKAALKNESYDIVVLAGDFIDSKEDSFQSLVDLVNLFDKKPVLFVQGADSISRLSERARVLRSMGVILLDETEEGFPIKKENELIIFTRFLINKKLTDNFVIGVVHDPAEFAVMGNQHTLFHYPPNLMIAGHTHGGQVNIPLIGALHVSNQGFFPKYVKGLYIENNSQLFITTGLGSPPYFPVRINNPPQVDILTLKRSD